MGRFTSLFMFVLVGMAVTSLCSVVKAVNFFNVTVIETIPKPTFCNADFLSVAMGFGPIYGDRNFNRLNFNSKKLQNLAAALSPANLRFGADRTYFLTFDENATKIDTRDVPYDYDNGGSWDDSWDMVERSWEDKNYQPFTMNGDQWERITRFAEKVGWNITFNLNLFKWRDFDNQVWDPTNAKQLLDFSARKGIKIAAFQLGNELNSNFHKYHYRVSPSSLVRAMQSLRNALKEYPEYSGSAIYGPEVTALYKHGKARTYFDEFFASGGCQAVDEGSWHHYYINGRTATVDQMMDPDILDGLKNDLESATTIMASHCDHVLPLRLTETSSCYGGGAKGLSDGYVAGFMWLDKLGLSAQAGLSVVHRQSFYSGAYALLQHNSLGPNPDYFLSVLYKRLILGPVLRASFEPSTKLLRMYAHCVRQDFYKYPAGAVVMYYMNLEKSDITLRLTKYKDEELDLFLLTPGDDTGLISRTVKLNDKELLMQGDELPSLEPKPHKGDIKVTAQSFGFIVIPNAQVKACL